MQADKREPTDDKEEAADYLCYWLSLLGMVTIYQYYWQIHT
jgi:hypothetical protein